MLRRAKIIIRHTLNVWKQQIESWGQDMQDGLAGLIALDDGKPWQILDGTERPQLFIPVPRAISGQGDQAIRQYVTMTEAFSRYKTQFGDPYIEGEPFSMLSISDPLTEWTYSERVDVLERCHLAWERNPDANAAVTYNRIFAVGGGMQRTYRNNTVRDAIEEFCDNPENEFDEIEKTLLDSLQTDGELFLRFHGDGDPGSIVMTPLPPWGIREITHAPGFLRRVTGYKYIIGENDGSGNALHVNETILPEDVIHVAINRLSYELRGRPELYKVLVWLEAHKEWLEDRARQNHYRGSLLYDVTLTNASGAQVNAKREQYKKPPSGQAALVIHNDKEAWNKFGDDINAEGAGEDGRQMRLKVSTGMRLPEYFLSDGSMSNLATAKAQALPAIFSFAEWQDIARDRIFRRVFLKVLERAGFDLNEEVPIQDEDGKNTGKTIKVREAFEIKYRSLDEEEPKSILEALQIAVANEWMSNETAAGMAPFDIDYEREVGKIAEERKREMDEINQGLRMAPPFMQANQPGQGDNNNGGKQNGRDEEQEQEPEKVP